MASTGNITTALKAQILQEVLQKTKINFEQNKHKQDENDAENLLQSLNNI